MKIKKTVTEAVKAANRANGKHYSTGPKTEKGKANASHNAFKHGIFAKKIEFETDEERQEFQKLLDQCVSDRRPHGIIERFLVEEIAICFWKLRITTQNEMEELLRFESATDFITDVLSKRSVDLPLDSSDLPIDGRWGCDKIVVRALAGEDRSNSGGARHPMFYQNQVINNVQQSSNNEHQHTSHLQVEAELGSPLSTILRHQAAVKRDLYKAFQMLRLLQAERHEKAQT